MNFIDFPQRNKMLAEDQPEYQTIPVFVDKRTIKTEEGPKEIPWSMTCVYEFTEKRSPKSSKTKSCSTGRCFLATNSSQYSCHRRILSCRKTNSTGRLNNIYQLIKFHFNYGIKSSNQGSN